MENYRYRMQTGPLHAEFYSNGMDMDLSLQGYRFPGCRGLALKLKLLVIVAIFFFDLGNAKKIFENICRHDDDSKNQ